MLRLRTGVRPALKLRGGGHAAHADAHAAHDGHHGLSDAAARYQNTVPRLFGEAPLAPGQKRQWGMWEKYHYALVFGTAALSIAALYKPNTNPRDWSLEEAAERMRRREAGLPVEYGVNYAGIRYMKEHGVLSQEKAEELEGGAVPTPYHPAVPAASPAAAVAAAKLE